MERVNKQLADTMHNQNSGVRRWKMFYFTKRSTWPAFGGLSEMFSISRHTATTAKHSVEINHSQDTAGTHTELQSGHQQFGILYQASLRTSFLSFVSPSLGQAQYRG
jgi:hypothetical protein